MANATKGSINAVVANAIAATALPGLTKKRQGYWVCITGPGITWELEGLLEPEHGAGMFRIGWCIRDSDVPAVLDLEDVPGTEHGTIGGDLGSFVQRRRGMSMLCLDGVGTGRLGRLWWGTRAESPEALTERIRSWIEQAAPVFMALDSRRDLAEFVDGFGRTYGRVDVHPETEMGRRQTAIALRALGGDAAWVNRALAEWEATVASQPANEFAREVQREYAARVRALISD